MKVIASVITLILLAPLGAIAQTPTHDDHRKVSCSGYNRHVSEDANLLADRQSHFEAGIELRMFSERFKLQFGAKRQTKQQAGQVTSHLDHSALVSVTFRF